MEFGQTYGIFHLFEKETEYVRFLKTYKINSKIIKYDNIKHNLTHLDLDIDILRVELKKVVNFDNYYWKNIYDTIGSSKPVIAIIKKLREEMDG